jgi:hypothetical protein
MVINPNSLVIAAISCASSSAYTDGALKINAMPDTTKAVLKVFFIKVSLVISKQLHSKKPTLIKT